RLPGRLVAALLGGGSHAALDAIGHDDNGGGDPHAADLWACAADLALALRRVAPPGPLRRRGPPAGVRAVSGPPPRPRAGPPVDPLQRPRGRAALPEPRLRAAALLRQPGSPLAARPGRPGRAPLGARADQPHRRGAGLMGNSLLDRAVHRHGPLSRIGLLER